MARYSASLVRSRSSAPASSIVLRATEPPHDLGHVVRLDVVAVAVVDGDDGRVPAAAEALDRAEGDLAVLGRLARRDPELGLEGVDHLLRAGEGAREVGADLDRVPPDGRQVEHVVEGRDRLAVGRGGPGGKMWKRAAPAGKWPGGGRGAAPPCSNESGVSQPPFASWASRSA